MNSFRLDGLHNLEAGYRTVSFTGLMPDDDDYEKKVRLLANILSGKLGRPVEPFRDGDRRRLAVAGSSERLRELTLPDQVALNPEVAFLELDPDLHPMRFEAGRGLATKLARRAVLWAVERVLASSASAWWRYGGRFIRRAPDEEASNAEIAVHPAFYFGVLPGKGGSFELAADPSVCYVERQSLFLRYGKDIPARIKGRRYLYRYGNEWYKIDAVGVGGPACKEMMVDPDTEENISIYERAVRRWGGRGLPAIESLVPEAPTVAYKTAGMESRRALSDLLYGLPGIEGEEEEGGIVPHQESIMAAGLRGWRTEEIIAAISSELRLFGRTMRPSRQLRALPAEDVHAFATPRLRFAGDQEVRISLERAGPDRMDALRGLGPAAGTPFLDHQLIVLPHTLPHDVAADFKRRFCLQVHDLYGQPYTPESLSFEDRPKLREQAHAIEKRLRPYNGYALLILPSGRDARQQTKLHDSLKRRLWRTVQTQCASAPRILGFYQEVHKHGETKWVVRQGQEGKYRSYLQLLALGHLMVNRKWLWKLAEGTLKHEVHVGIDVYKGVAVFTFIYGDADLITFRVSKATRAEKLSAEQVEEVLIENLGADLSQLGLMPKTIVFHRDGLAFDSEVRGINRAISRLQSPQMNVLPADVRVGIVEIHKRSSTRPRVYRRHRNDYANPAMGTCVRLGRYEAAVLTTGEPMLRRGTAHPLYLGVVSGDVDVVDVAHDVYALSHLAFTAPGSCLRLPFTIALADHILREATPGKEEELWDEEREQGVSSLALSPAFGNSERRFQ